MTRDMVVDMAVVVVEEVGSLEDVAGDEVGLL